MKKRMLVGLLVVGGVAFAAKDSTDWTTTKLNDSAVTDESGAIVVLGTEGSWGDNADRTRAAVFDGDTATFFDPTDAATAAGGSWAGIELAEARCVTRIRYFGREAYKDRMIGCLFQGANTADFSDAVTLHVASAADGWNGTAWADVFVANEAALQPFKYLRVISPNIYPDEATGVCAGNAAEVEFYGVPASKFTEKFAGKVPTFPENYIQSQYCINNYFTFGVAYSSRVPFYEVQRKPSTAGDDAWVDCGSIPFVYDGYTATSAVGYLFRDPTPIYVPTDYRVRASANLVNAASDWLSLGTQDPGLVATGTWIGPTGSWGDVNDTTRDGSKAYDGNVSTFTDLPTETNTGGWTGLDLGEVRTIVGAKAAPRGDDFYTRLEGSLLQVANELIADPAGKTDWEFADPVTVGTFTGATRTGVVTVTLDVPVEARYVRVKAPDGQVFNLSEFEVDLEQSTPPVTVSPADWVNLYPALAWENYTLEVSPRDAIAVYRAVSAEGPWTELAVLDAEAQAYVDETIPVGPRYHYAVAYRQGAKDGRLQYVSYRRGRRLDRGTDETTLLAGVSLACNGTPWGAGAGSKDKPFDGDTGSYADMNENAAYIGLAFADPVGVSAVRAYPRAGQLARLDGVGVWGMNDAAEWRASGDDPATALAEPFVCTAAEWVHTLGTAGGLYTYVVLGRAAANNWNCNVSEIQVYGWTQADLDQVLVAPEAVDFTVEEKGLVLAWKPSAKAASYNVRRRRGDAAWEESATGLTEPTWMDAAAVYDGTVYSYQIVAVGADGATMPSEVFSKLPYLPGDGTGLYGVYTKNFKHGYDATEAVALERVDAQINFDWDTGAPAEVVGSDYFKVVWTGKLIAPFAGTYAFSTQQDDGLRLQIDGQDVINDINNWSGGFACKGSILLGAGEHDIRIDFIEQVGNAYCRLKWGGCVPEEIVPTSQLKPVKVEATVPAPWAGARQFGGALLGDGVFNEDGSLLLSSGGHDIWGGTEGFYYAWRKVKGPFQATVKIDLANVPQVSLSARAMLMVRTALEQGEPFFCAEVEGGTSTPRTNCKARPGRSADEVAIADVMAWTYDYGAQTCWLRVSRERDTLTYAYRAGDNDPWEDLFTYEMPADLLGDELFVGPATGSGSTSVLCYARFTEFKLEQLLKPTVIFFR